MDAREGKIMRCDSDIKVKCYDADGFPIDGKFTQIKEGSLWKVCDIWKDLVTLRKKDSYFFIELRRRMFEKHFKEV